MAIINLDVPDILSVLLDFFGLFLVDLPKLIPRVALCSQQFVQFSVNGLRISVLGTLNEQRHEPRRDGRDPLPVEGTPGEQHPGRHIESHNDEDQRM
jgi:hypothetical protein